MTPAEITEAIIAEKECLASDREDLRRHLIEKEEIILDIAIDREQIKTRKANIARLRQQRKVTP